jgi:methionyl-tRNA formyltransferase
MKEKILELRKKGYSYNQIVEELECAKSTVSYHLRNVEESKFRPKNEEDVKIINDTYLSNLSVKKTAKELKMDRNTIIKYLSEDNFIIFTNKKNSITNKTKSDYVIDWRKRTKLDGLIDFRMSTSSIVNLIRALTKPFPGAYCEINGNEYKIWKCEQTSFTLNNNEPGKVLAVSNNFIEIKTGDGSIRLIEHELPTLTKGEYLRNE